MGKIVNELPSIKRFSTDCRQGLRKLSPELIGKARDNTAAQVTRIGLTFLGTTAFCLSSLLSPDSALLGGSEKINVPFAGPVSFFGFMLLGPAVLIVVRVYLQIYVEHSNRLDRLPRSARVVRAPILVPLQNPLIRLFSGFIFYLLLPVAMMLFALKAAVFPAWGAGLSGVAGAVIASHVMLLPWFRRLTWRSRALLSAGAATLIWGVLFGLMNFGLEPLRRPFELARANLSGQWLVDEDLGNANLFNADLRGANLTAANLTGANLLSASLSNADLSNADLTAADLTAARLIFANLSNANLSHAGLSNAHVGSTDLSNAYLLYTDLSGAHLGYADLSGAHLGNANLSNADLTGAYLAYADLSGADLSSVNLSNADLRAKGLTQKQLDEACGDADTKLPEGFTLKLCSTGQ